MTMGASPKTIRTLTRASDAVILRRRITALEGDVRELVDIAVRNRIGKHPGIFRIATRHKLPTEL